MGTQVKIEPAITSYFNTNCDRAEAVWSDAGGEVPVHAGAKVFEVVDGARSAVAAGGKLRAKAQSVYVIET